MLKIKSSCREQAVHGGEGEEEGLACDFTQILFTALAAQGA